MKCQIILVMSLLLFVFCGCQMSSVSTSTETCYDKDGKIEKVTITESKEGWLSKKIVSVGVDGYVVEISTAVDPTTGMIMPTIKGASGGTDITTLPAIPFDKMSNLDVNNINANKGFCNFKESFYFEKSLWGDKAAKLKYERTGAGAGIPDATVRMNVLSIVEGTPVNTNESSVKESLAVPVAEVTSDTEIKK